MLNLIKPVTFATILIVIAGTLFAGGEKEDNRILESGLPGLEEVIREMQDDYELIDVRTPGEYESGYIPTAKNIPVNELQERSSELDPDKRIYLYCRSGNRSATAAKILEDAGFTDVVDYGGINNWKGERERP
jgi:phage shock protein E